MGHMSEEAFRKLTGATSPKKRPAKSPTSASAALFVLMCHANGLPTPTPEHVFHDVRKWRFDWCWIEQKVALEIEGGIWTGGAHTRGEHFLSDVDKYNAATVAGWRVLRTTPERVESGEVFAMLKEVL